jgi:hypothetical protein
MVSPNTNRITGSVADNGLAVGIELCNTAESCTLLPVTPAQTAAWSYALPVGEASDGEQQQLWLFGKDSAGNVSTTPISLTYMADAIAPVMTVTQQLERLSLEQMAAGTPVLFGNISDGGGVQRITANILPVAGNAFDQQPVAIDQTTWSYTPTGLAVGEYFVTMEARDVAGNSSTSEVYTLLITP